MFIEKLKQEDIRNFFKKYYSKKNRVIKFNHFIYNGTHFVKVEDCDATSFMPIYEIRDFEIIPKSKFARYDCGEYGLKKEWIKFMANKFNPEYNKAMQEYKCKSK